MIAAPASSAVSPPRALIGFVLLSALVMLAGAGKAVQYDTLDPDLFIHLNAAEQLSRDGVGPIVDRHSYTASREPWTPYSWLAELGMKAVWDAGGYRAAVATHALLAALILGGVALACAGAGGSGRSRLACVVATALAALLTLPYLSFRPVTAALALMAACVWLLVRDRRLAERSRAVWTVVPVTALLVNIHLYAIVVPMWLGALSAGAAWEWWRVRDRESARRLRRYVLLLAGSALACLATPMLPGVMQSILYYQAADPMVSGPVVAEYQPFYHETAGKISAAIVLAVFACAAINRGRLRAGEFLLLVVGLVLLLRMGRFAPVFGMTAAPILAVTLPGLSDKLLGRRTVCAAVAAVLAVGVWRVASAFPRRETPMAHWVNRHGPECPGYPCAAADYVASSVNPSSGRLINEYTWGGYLSWRLGDRYQVLLDGRTNVHPPAVWEATYYAGAERRREFLAAAGADAAVVPAGRSLFRDDLLAMGWTSRYRDERAEVLVPPSDGTSSSPSRSSLSSLR